MYLGLHVGEVFYGNVGSRERLDFTVLGPAVNEASRIAAMCRSVDQPILLSTAFADVGEMKRSPPLGGTVCIARAFHNHGSYSRSIRFRDRPCDSTGLDATFNSLDHDELLEALCLRARRRITGRRK